ncbi:MAG: response regulator [Lachnospiraceae bacterium]|nr:response regulator [Lachnospiraceae bacterium]
MRYDLQDGIYYDLLLLDIEMPGVDGMELAEHIHDDMAAARIIFITSHLEYAIEAYEFSVFRYIPKNKIDEKPYRTDRIPGYFVYSEGREI